MISTEKTFSLNKPSMDEKPSFFHDQMLGKLALSYRFIGKKEYERAQLLRKMEWDSGLETSLMEIFIKHDLLSKEKIEILHYAKDLLTQMRKEKRFGAIAVKNGLLSETDLDLALEAQKKEKTEIGNILMDSGLLSPDQCKEILEIQKRITVKLPPLKKIVAELNDSGKNGEEPPSEKATCGLNISEDEYTAVLVLPSDGKTIDISEVHRVLEESGITFGTLDDAVIQEHLDHMHLGLTSFIIAKGQKGIAGTSGEHTLHFSPRELKAGQLDANGTMDYRNRGDIPFVKKGDLLAEIRQMEQSMPGMNVFGKTVHMEEIDDTEFTLHGHGTVLNETGDRLYAEYDGEPGITMDGSVCVLNDLRVEHVDFQTGNISFPGNVIISGKVNPDFEVEGFNITAQEVSGARLVAKGDIVVEGGIIGGDVTAGGRLHSTYIKDSKIACIGDIVSEKEIIDSIVETSGSLSVKGHILSSKINAGKGITANNIGSKTSRPSQLEVGFFSSVLHLITRQQETDKELDRELSELDREKVDLSRKIEIIQNTIRKMEQHLSVSKKHYQAFKENIHRIETKRKKSFPNGQAKLVQLYKKITTDKETIDALNRNVAHYQLNMDRLGKKIRLKRDDQAKARRTIRNMIQWMNENETNPSVRVCGEIYEGTEIISPNTTLVLKNDFSNVKIREVARSVSPDEAGGKKELQHAFEITQPRRQSVRI